MKMIHAYIRSHMAPKILDELRTQRIHGVSVFQGKGFGRLSNGPEPHYLDPDTTVGFVEVTKLELVCEDAMAETIVDVIRTKGHTGRHGDGKIFVVAISSACDIRTGASGDGVV